ncbi:hypothetical protein Tco_0185883 [Tanacetum coccineum]
MHNNIMAAGSKDRPPMLGPGRYSQWRSRFLRYLDTKSNGEYLRKCIFEDEIYSTVDACNTAKEMWTAIERLQQGESLNVQDVKTNLFWEFGKFTSRDGESMESYYSRFYKLMNELTRNNLQVSTMQVNVQFLQQLQPEWSRFVTIVKQKEEIDKPESANPLALLAAAQPYSDNLTIQHQNAKIKCTTYSNLFHSTKCDYQPQRQKRSQTSKHLNRSPCSEEDRDPEHLGGIRYYAKEPSLALLAKLFQEAVKPTNNNLRTSLNSRNAEKPKRVKTTPSTRKDMIANKLNTLLAKIQGVSLKNPVSNKSPLEQVQNQDENDVFANVNDILST